MKSVSVHERELWYADCGAGLPLLLVHGFPLDHKMWAGQIDSDRPNFCGNEDETVLLGAKTSVALRLLAPDLRGFGRSPASGDRVTMEDFADDLADLLDAIGIHEPIVLCGLSMGGYIALQFCRKYAARLRGLILCDTRAAADSAEAAASRLAMADRVLREGPAPLAETMLPKLFAEATWQQRPDVVEGVRRTIMANDPRGIAAAARGMAERPDMTAALSEICCPTLVIVGHNDTISTPAEMRAIAEAIPNAQLAKIPNAGHLSPLENPADFNAALGEFVTAIS